MGLLRAEAAADMPESSLEVGLRPDALTWTLGMRLQVTKLLADRATELQTGWPV